MNSPAMNKTVVALAASLFLGVGGAVLAQGTPPFQPIPNTTLQNQAQPSRLIGKNVQSQQNDIIGFINSVAVGADGLAQSVMVGVGGYLGVGDRDVEIKWSELRVSDDDKITVNMTKDQIAALPEYRYAEPAQRGTAFRSFAMRTPPDAAQTPEARATPEAQPTPETPAPGPTVAAKGGVTAKKLLGLNVYGPQDTTVGSIKDIILDDEGSAESAVISVGGIMGFGAKDVMVAWNELRLTRNGDDIKASVPMTAEQLKALPETQEARGIWVLK